MPSDTVKPPSDLEDEDAAWEKFNPLKDDFENAVENSYFSDSVGGTLPRKLLNKRECDSEKIKLYVGKIPVNITESGLRNIFSKFGTAFHVKLMKSKTDGAAYNYAFISLSNILEANRAIQKLHQAPPFYLHIEFEISQEERKDRVLIETCATTLDKMTSNLNHPETPLYEADADFSIKENVSYSPCIPLQGIDLTQMPSCVDTLLPYHLYDDLPQNIELYEPYLVWDSTNSADVSHTVALLHYISPDHWLGQGLKQNVEPSTKTVSVENNSEKTFGVESTRPILVCAFCSRRVFKTSPLRCKCGVIYDDILCQHKHWPQHKSQCTDQTNATDTNDIVRTELVENDFAQVLKAFREFYSTCGTVLDREKLDNCPIDIVPQLWYDENTALVFVTTKLFIKSVLSSSSIIETLPDITAEQTHIGQLVGVFEDGSELYVRAIVACKTRRGLIGVLPLEMGTFSLVQSVKLLPPLVESMEGAWNVKCNVKERDKNFAIEGHRQYTKLKSTTNQFRSFDEDLNFSTVELVPYFPTLEQLPLTCINIDSKSQVILTAFHSARALYIQPLDMNTRIRYASMASALNLWCSNNHPQPTTGWVSSKNQVVGVRLPSGEYRRGQVIGKVVAKQSGDKGTQEDANICRYYVVTLIDSGDNAKVACEDLVCLPSHLKQDPCYCTRISLRNTNIILNAVCFKYLSVLVKTRTPLVVNLIDDEFMTANLTLESGDDVCDLLVKRTVSAKEMLRDDAEKDPTKTDRVASLPDLRVPLYPLVRGQSVYLRLMKVLDPGYASMLVLSREETQYVHQVLEPSLREYAELLGCDKYNPLSGSYCLAYCRELKLWTRAFCEKSSNQHGHCFVFLVDHGIYAHLPISDLRPCHELFTQYHSLSFVAYIPELENTELSEAEMSGRVYKVLDIVNCDKQIAQDRVVLGL